MGPSTLPAVAPTGGDMPHPNVHPFGVVSCRVNLETGEIRWLASTIAVTGYQECNGALLTPGGSPALFDAIGNAFGGDGVTTFALPDLRGRSPMHRGAGPGLTPRTRGEKLGTETHTLTTPELPSHTHALP